MARTWPGNTSTAYLTTPASASMNFNTNVCLMAIVRPTEMANQHVITFAGIPGEGSALQSVAAGGLIFTKLGNINLQTTTIGMTLNEWNAVMAWSTNSGNALFKIYRYSNSTLTTETVVDTNPITMPTTDPERIGNNSGTPTTTESWAGDIDRIYIGQGTTPSDAEFTAWARAGTVPPSLTTKGYWVLSPSGTATNPEVDLSPNGLNITSITGTTASAAFVLPDAVVGLAWLHPSAPSRRQSYRVVTF